MSDDWTRYREELLRSIGYEEGKRIGEAMVIRGFLKNFSPAIVAEMFEVPLERVLEIKENEDYDDESSMLKKMQENWKNCLLLSIILGNLNLRILAGWWII